jgi:hypothetical protein
VIHQRDLSIDEQLSYDYTAVIRILRVRTLKLLLVSFLLLVYGAVVLLCAATGGLHYVSRIYGPTLEFPEETGRDHLGQCGPSNDKLEDLIVNETHPPEEAKEGIDKYGAAIFQNVITKEAAQNLRDYAMTANHDLE